MKAFVREQNARGSGNALRAELVAAATEMLLAPQQVTAPSLRAAARACNVSPAAVYLHFESQNALVAAVVLAQLTDLQDSVSAGTRGKQPDDQLRAMAKAYVRWGLAHPGAYQLIFESADVLPAYEISQSPGDDLLVIVEALVRAACPSTRGPAAAQRIWTALHGLVSLRIHKPNTQWSVRPDREATLIVDAVLASL